MDLTLANVQNVTEGVNPDVVIDLQLSVGAELVESPKPEHRAEDNSDTGLHISETLTILRVWHAEPNYRSLVEAFSP